MLLHQLRKEFAVAAVPETSSEAQSIAVNKEIQMITINTVTYVNDVPVQDLKDDRIFELIARTEGEIKQLEGIENKPKALVTKIESMQASIKELIDIMDARTTSGV